MTPNQARDWLIKASLFITGVTFLFLLAVPPLGYPLTFGQSIRALEIILPVFFGYLGSATIFYFSTNAPPTKITKRLPMSLIKGPIILFAIISITLFAVFGFSNRVEAEPGSGMNVDSLAAILALALGLLTVTTNVVISYLFTQQEKRS